jgi:hypothetical protein
MECDTKQDPCVCCYCSEKRHKLMSLLKPSTAKFAPKQLDPRYASHYRVYKDADRVIILDEKYGKNIEFVVDAVDHSDPYEYKYRIRYPESATDPETNQIKYVDQFLDELIPESKLKLYPKRNIRSVYVKYSPNGTIWVVGGCEVINDEMYYSVSYKNDNTLKTRIKECYLEEYKPEPEPEKEKESTQEDLNKTKSEKCNCLGHRILRAIMNET